MLDLFSDQTRPFHPAYLSFCVKHDTIPLILAPSEWREVGTQGRTPACSGPLLYVTFYCFILFICNYFNFWFLLSQLPLTSTGPRHFDGLIIHFFDKPNHFDFESFDIVSPRQPRTARLSRPLYLNHWIHLIRFINLIYVIYVMYPMYSSHSIHSIYY